MLIVAFAAVAGGCAVDRAPRSDTESVGIDSSYRPEVLRTYLNEYAVSFAAKVETAASRIQRSSEDPSLRRNALLWKARAIPEMRKACFRPDPLGALFDAWMFSRQMQDFFVSGAGAEAFGPFQPDVVGLCDDLVKRIVTIRDVYTTPDGAMARMESDLIEPWIAENPIADFSFARNSVIASFAEYTRKGGGAFQSVANIDEQVSNLAQQIRLVLADMPKQVRWEADLVAQDMISTEDLDGLLADAGRITDAVDRAVGVVEQVPDLVREEREAVLREVDRQRILMVELLAGERNTLLEAITKERNEILAAVAEERKKVLTAFADERAEVIENVDAQRLATLEWAAGERELALETLNQEIDSVINELRIERGLVLGEVGAIADRTVIRADGELEELVDRAMLRIALLAVLGAAAAPFVAHVYVRVWPRRK